MLTFERTLDLELVRQVLIDEAVFPFVGDDSVGKPEDLALNEDARIWYVLVKERRRVIGAITFGPHSDVLWEVHVALLENRTARGAEIFAASLQWMFRNSSAERIIGEVPECNQRAVNMVRKVMTFYGVNPKSFMKRGVLEDLVLFGISKGE